MDAVNELNGEIYIITVSSRFQNRCVCAISLLFCFRLFQLFGGIPEAAIDAETINERELVYYYTFDESGKEALKAKGLKLTASGRLVPLDEK